MPITQEQKEFYLKHPNTCPFCNLETLDSATLETDDNNSHVSSQVRCFSCKRKWRDIYTITDIEEIK